jgi:hypothetical protein
MKNRPAPELPRPVRKAVHAARRWTHPATHPMWAALVSGILAAGELPTWAPILAAVVMWGEGRIWPDSRREWLSVATGALCVGAVIPDPRAAAGLSAVLATIEVLVEHTVRGRSWERRRAILDAWPAVAEATGAEDVTVQRVEATRWRDRITIRGPQGATMHAPAVVARQIASALLMPISRVTGSPGHESGSVVIDVSHGDPFAAPVRHPLPSRPGRKWSAPIGVDDAGRTIAIDLRKHTLVAGMTGAGKSTAVQALLLSALPHLDRGNLRLVLIDRKGGVELGMWADHADLVDIGDNGDKGTTDLLAAVVADINRRLDIMRGAGVRDWDVRFGPRWLVVIDEAAVIRDQIARDLLRDAALRGRAAGVSLVVALQHPVKETIDRSTVLQLDQRIGMRVKDRAASRHVADGDEPDLTSLEFGGHFFLLGGRDARRGRIYNVEDDMLPTAHPVKGSHTASHETATDSDLTSQCPVNDQSNDAPIDPEDGPQYVSAPARPLSGTVSPDIAAKWTGTAGLILGALDGSWRPIAAVRLDIGISESTWRRHASALDDAGLIERDGTSARLTPTAMGIDVGVVDEMSHHRATLNVVAAS